jgi:parallel beta-helix repeat protein
MNVRKLGLVSMSVAVVVIGGALVSWSAAGSHGHSHQAGRTTESGLAAPAAAAASPTPKPTATPKPKSSTGKKTAAKPQDTINPAHKTAASSPGCGETVTKSIHLIVNLINCPHDGIVIGANNITVDLGEFSVSGTKAAKSEGIRNDRGFKNVTIRGGTISGFETAIVVGGKGAIHNTIDSVEVTGNANGILLSGGANSVSGNTIEKNSAYGIKAASDSNEITKNDVTDGKPGILLSGSSNKIIDNTIEKGGDSIAGVGSSNDLDNNSLRDGAGSAIVLLGSDNSITSNAIRHFGSVGIWMQQSGETSGTPTNASGTAVQSGRARDNTLSENDVSSAGHDGILVDSDTSTIDSNDSSHNSGDGIATRGTNDLIKDNDANGNTGHGISANGGVRGTGNSAQGNGQSNCSPAALCD